MSVMDDVTGTPTSPGSARGSLGRGDGGAPSPSGQGLGEGWISDEATGFHYQLRPSFNLKLRKRVKSAGGLSGVKASVDWDLASEDLLMPKTVKLQANHIPTGTKLVWSPMVNEVQVWKRIPLIFQTVPDNAEWDISCFSLTLAGALDYKTRKTFMGFSIRSRGHGRFGVGGGQVKYRWPPGRGGAELIQAETKGSMSLSKPRGSPLKGRMNVESPEVFMALQEINAVISV